MLNKKHMRADVSAQNGVSPLLLPLRRRAVEQVRDALVLVRQRVARGRVPVAVLDVAPRRALEQLGHLRGARARAWDDRAQRWKRRHCWQTKGPNALSSNTPLLC